LEDLPEEELLALCRKFDRSAQFELYRRYKDSLFTLAMRMGMEAADAEWALQDGFIQIFKSISSFQGNSGLYAWMRTILLRSIVKTKNVLIQPIDPLESYLEKPEETISDWGEQTLQVAFEQLPAGYKAALTLYYLEEMTHKEIAMILNISEGTSKSQLFYAKQKLRNLIKP